MEPAARGRVAVQAEGYARRWGRDGDGPKKSQPSSLPAFRPPWIAAIFALMVAMLLVVSSGMSSLRFQLAYQAAENSDF